MVRPLIPLGATGARAGGSPRPPIVARRITPTGYRRLVRVLRVVLPLLALAMIVLVAAWPQIVPNRAAFQVGYADLDVSDADLQMTGARFVATDADNRPYSVTARAVRNPLGGDGTMLLDGPEAEITLSDGAWLWATADQGEFRIADDWLDLTGGVRLIHDAGHELTSASASIDLAGGVMTGSEPVTGHGPYGELTGSGFRVSDGGRRLLLTGKSTLTVYPKSIGGTGGGQR